ncbi:Uncharacterised protein [Mycobacteroides abscessus]|nr:Uncharacterised protein [Mycobacteroides abscessus]
MAHARVMRSAGTRSSASDSLHHTIRPPASTSAREKSVSSPPARPSVTSNRVPSDRTCRRSSRRFPLAATGISIPVGRGRRRNTPVASSHGSGSCANTEITRPMTAAGRPVSRHVSTRAASHRSRGRSSSSRNASRSASAVSSSARSRTAAMPGCGSTT